MPAPKQRASFARWMVEELESMNWSSSRCKQDKWQAWQLSANRVFKIQIASNCSKCALYCIVEIPNFRQPLRKAVLMRLIVYILVGSQIVSHRSSKFPCSNSEDTCWSVVLVVLSTSPQLSAQVLPIHLQIVRLHHFPGHTYWALHLVHSTLADIVQNFYSCSGMRPPHFAEFSILLANSWTWSSSC